VEFLIFPCAVKTEDFPVLVEQAEVTRLLLPDETRILQQDLEVAVSAGVHVVIAVERPRPDLRRFVDADRPESVRQHTLLVLPTEARIVHVAQMDDMLRTLLPQA